MIIDAHRLFCLLGPVNPNHKTLPEILFVTQVYLENEVYKRSIMERFSKYELLVI